MPDDAGAQYREWLDSLRSKVSRCLEQVNLFKLVDEAVALLVEAKAQPIAAKGTELVTESLFQLINRLSIPADLNSQIETLRSRLDEEITQQALWQLQTDIRALASVMQERLEKEVDGVAVLLQCAIRDLQELQSSLHPTNSVRREEPIPSLAILNTQCQLLQGQADKGQECLNQEQIESASGAQSDIDPLTGVANQPAFEKLTAHAFAHWKRYGAWLSLVIMEVDQFDQIRAGFGPHSSDKLLKALAIVLNRLVRETDVLACYESGAFALLLPETSLSDAMAVADKLRRAVESCNFRYNGAPVAVTLSCGAAEFHPNDTPESVLERAKGFLYLAKNSGRNRCCGEVESAMAAA